MRLTRRANGSLNDARLEGDVQNPVSEYGSSETRPDLSGYALATVNSRDVEGPAMPSPTDDPHTTTRRGFAAMDPERRREIAKRGGASVPGEKRSFAQNRDLAADAGRKGGAASRGGGRRPSPT
jgi:general stress protein YciG